MRRTRKAGGKTLTDDLAIAAYREAIAHYCKLGDRVIDQWRRHGLEGVQVPDAEKIYCIFAPRTDFIKRGKVHTPLEFGHKVFLTESANGLITQYAVLDGNPNDHRYVEASLERHEETFGKRPRGVWVRSRLLR